MKPHIPTLRKVLGLITCVRGILERNKSAHSPDFIKGGLWAVRRLQGRINLLTDESLVKSTPKPQIPCKHCGRAFTPRYVTSKCCTVMCGQRYRKQLNIDHPKTKSRTW